MVNLFLACIWLGFGGWLLFLHYVKEIDRLPLKVLEINTLMIGWLAVVLSAYNVVRWWSQRTTQWERRAIDQRGSHPRHIPRRSAEPPNPDFDFTKPPPRSDPADRPPSPN